MAQEMMKNEARNNEMEFLSVLPLLCIPNLPLGLEAHIHIFRFDLQPLITF